ncbi:MAG: hypothetical protein EOP83_36435 [Verrucomicrobiaceae bacterium]|nr:MAG: hypothetical protein EOP83_36435 [Verrucomicrobiaceae bacterium]
MKRPTKAIIVNAHSMYCEAWEQATYFTIWQQYSNYGEEGRICGDQVIEWMRDQFGPPGGRWLYENKTSRLNLIIRHPTDACAFKMVYG